MGLPTRQGGRVYADLMLRMGLFEAHAIFPLTSDHHELCLGYRGFTANPTGETG